jgi:hypothetical protein
LSDVHADRADVTKVAGKHDPIRMMSIDSTVDPNVLSGDIPHGGAGCKVEGEDKALSIFSLTSSHCIAVLYFLFFVSYLPQSFS